MERAAISSGLTMSPAKVKIKTPSKKPIFSHIQILNKTFIFKF